MDAGGVLKEVLAWPQVLHDRCGMSPWTSCASSTSGSGSGLVKASGVGRHAREPVRADDDEGISRPLHASTCEHTSAALPSIMRNTNSAIAHCWTALLEPQSDLHLTDIPSVCANIEAP